ncbi:unnamed protein product, partial [marine sediment metagenome]
WTFNCYSLLCVREADLPPADFAYMDDFHFSRDEFRLVIRHEDYSERTFPTKKTAYFLYHSRTTGGALFATFIGKLVTDKVY